MTFISSARPSRSRRASPARAELAGLVALGVLVALAGVLYGRLLHVSANYDEGVYLASLDDLRHGASLGSDVFASQPPGFYALIRACAAIFGAVRDGLLVVALAGVVAAYAVGRTLAGHLGALLTAGLYLTAPTLAQQAPRIEADPPSVALAVIALAFAAAAVDGRYRTALWAAAGASLALALSVKLLVAPVVVPLVALAVLARMRAREAAAALAAAAVVAVVFVAVHAGSLGSIWSDAVTFQTGGSPDVSGNLRAIRPHLFELRTPFTWLVAIGAVTTVFTWRRQAPAWALWTLLPASIVFLATRAPLLDHHLALLAPALALPTGVALGRELPRLHGTVFAASVGAIAILVAAAYAQDWRQIQRNNAGEPAWVVSAAGRLRSAVPPGRLVVTDLPILAHRAGRRVPGDLVDTSFVRFKRRSLTDAGVIRELDAAHPAAAAAAREFTKRPAILAALRRRFRTEVRIGEAVLYLDPR